MKQNKKNPLMWVFFIKIFDKVKSFFYISHMRTYKTLRPFLVPKRNGKGYIQFAKNQVIFIGKNKCYVQGKTTPIKLEVFEDIPTSNITEVFDITKEFLNENVLPHEELKKVKLIHSKAKKLFPKYSKILKTIETWAFKPKGSTAIKIEGEIEFQKNNELILESTILGNGTKAKPGCAVMNRGTERNGPFVENEDEWSQDKETLLPYGIRKSDYASQSEQVKIYKKIVLQVISMEDCDQDVKRFFEKNLNLSSYDVAFNDYLPLIDKKTRENLGYQKLLISDFKKNLHHSKEKGLELCHLDPWIDFPTTADNLTIGSSLSNRIQGGYPLWFKKLVLL